MATPTFLRLPQEKREHIEQAMLDEFSRVPLQEAQVSNIVKRSGIARGAFYRYFVDITEAYRYMLSLALRDIHEGIPSAQFDTVQKKGSFKVCGTDVQTDETNKINKTNETNETNTTAATALQSQQDRNTSNPCNANSVTESYYQRTVQFVNTTAHSRYYRMMYWYYRDNSTQYAQEQSNSELDARNWTIATLTHQTIRECMLDSEHSETYLQRLHKSLQALDFT